MAEKSALKLTYNLQLASNP